MTRLALLGSFLAGCSYYISPVGPSLCPDEPGLYEVADAAALYWNAAGTKLDTSCTPGAVLVHVRNVPYEGPLGITDYQIGHQPFIEVDWILVNWADGPHDWIWRRTAWILAHELGHAMGLKHVDEPDSVMFGGWIEEMTDEPGPTDRRLAAGLMGVRQ